MIADTSGLLAFFNGSEPTHDAVAQAVAEEREPIVVPPYVLAELGYLIGTRVGVEAELATLSELVGGAWELATFGAVDLLQAVDIIDRHRDQTVGIADASIVVLADRFRTRTVLTLDHRHFDVLRPLSGGRFSLVP